MSVSNFRFSTNILRRLGEELNPSPDQSIIELVKNAYDANAHECVISIQNTSQPGGSIKIEDDGDGMDSHTIENGWLVLGSSEKNKTTVTRLNRIPTGNKGLGRLAALRMGKIVKLTSRPRSEPDIEYKLSINWKDFDTAVLVEDIDLEIGQSTRGTIKNDGTLIELKDLRMSLGRMDVKRIARSLILLADPFGEDPNSFRPILEAAEFADLEKLVRNRYFDEADYHLIGKLDEAGEASTKVVDWQGNVLFEGTHKEIANKRKGAVFDTVPAQFDFWTFLLGSNNLAIRLGTKGDLREWLSDFGGVHLYENGLRVAPYGNAGNDWLEMNLSRSRSPEERPSTNNSIGCISIHSTADLLQQKTDRSGFIETQAFNELKEFAMATLNWMARKRLDEAEKRRTQDRVVSETKVTKTKKTIEDAIDAAPKSVKDQLSTAFSTYDKAREREIKTLQKEIQLYRTLSTAGITAATFAHESTGNSLKVISVSLSTLESHILAEIKHNLPDSINKPINRIKIAISSLGVLASATLRLLDHEKRKYGRVDLHKVILEVLTTYHPFIEARKVLVETNFIQAEPYYRGSRAALESVITNLLNNCLQAFETADSLNKRQIKIITSIDGSNAVIRILDNGPGINDIKINDIWLPGETTRPNGTGLGLTIVRDTIIDIGGKTSALEHGELGGAEFILQIPLIGW
jgi:signal transduction histidine kinase